MGHVGQWKNSRRVHSYTAVRAAERAAMARCPWGSPRPPAPAHRAPYGTAHAPHGTRSLLATRAGSKAPDDTCPCRAASHLCVHLRRHRGCAHRAIRRARAGQHLAVIEREQHALCKGVRALHAPGAKGEQGCHGFSEWSKRTGHLLLLAVLDPRLQFGLLGKAALFPQGECGTSAHECHGLPHLLTVASGWAWAGASARRVASGARSGASFARQPSHSSKSLRPPLFACTPKLRRGVSAGRCRARIGAGLPASADWLTEWLTDWLTDWLRCMLLSSSFPAAACRSCSHIRGLSCRSFSLGRSVGRGLGLRRTWTPPDPTRAYLHAFSCCARAGCSLGSSPRLRSSGASPF